MLYDEEINMMISECADIYRVSLDLNIKNCILKLVMNYLQTN